MKKLLESVLIGSSGKASGLISLGIIMLIVLGCNCKNLDFGKTGGDERTTVRPIRTGQVMIVIRTMRATAKSDGSCHPSSIDS